MKSNRVTTGHPHGVQTNDSERWTGPPQRPATARQLWSNTPAAEPPGCASSALDWRSRQESWRYSIFICHTYIARTLVVNDQTSKCKNRKFVVVKELYETWKASWSNKKHFLHFFEAVLTVFKSTLNNACVRSYLLFKRSAASGDEKGGKARTGIDRNGTGRGKLSRVPFFETKRIEMNNHVLKWKYPVSQQSDSSTR